MSFLDKVKGWFGKKDEEASASSQPTDLSTEAGASQAPAQPKPPQQPEGSGGQVEGQ